MLLASPVSESKPGKDFPGEVAAPCSITGPPRGCVVRLFLAEKTGSGRVTLAHHPIYRQFSRGGNPFTLCHIQGCQAGVGIGAFAVLGKIQAGFLFLGCDPSGNPRAS
ncbi:hypothetical protein [Moorella sp. E306M]|uniref:hypothetical protein n=1 Tax=Moorella sp. E306M TaxID=2572683 RepID=UPI00155AFE63|nr:hypothetical protein [Moorella sp. E306M]